jgi:type II secretory pathway pseudopilin PulG
MEFVVYVSIGVACFSILWAIIAFTWLRYDKRREQREQEAHTTAVVQ